MIHFNQEAQNHGKDYPQCDQANKKLWTERLEVNSDADVIAKVEAGRARVFKWQYRTEMPSHQNAIPCGYDDFHCNGVVAVLLTSSTSIGPPHGGGTKLVVSDEASGGSLPPH